MKHSLNIRLIGRLLLCIAAALSTYNAHARETLITKDDKLNFTSPNSEWTRGNASPGGITCQTEQGPENIVNTKTIKTWCAGDGNDFNGTEFYLQMNFSDKPLSLEKGQSLVFMIRRAANNLPHPTTMRIEGSNDLENWDGDVLGYIYWLYRGEYTIEFSERIDFRLAKQSSYKYLRLFCEHNYQREITAKGRRTMSMTFFQIYKLDEGEPYMDPNNATTAVFEDRFHLRSDYNKNMQDYSFVQTNSILAEVNHNTDGLKNWADWSKWDADGKWIGDNPTTLQKKYNFVMPEFTPLTHEKDKDITTGTRQPAHVTEHVYYAIPGDAIPLYPYFDIAHTAGYEENFFHWYDYRTGGDMAELDFLIDPSTIVPVNGHGYLGGKPVTSMHYDLYIKTVDEYLDFVKRVNAGETTLSAQLLNDLDFESKGTFTKVNFCIGNLDNLYRGTFDGNGFTIKNLKIHVADGDRIGMFGVVGHRAWIGNFILDETCSFEGKQTVGSAVGLYRGNRDIDEKDETPFTLERVFSKASVKCSAERVGGLIGEIDWSGKFMIQQCGFAGTVEGNKAASIIGCYNAGRSWGNSPLVEVYNYGTVINTTDGDNGRKWFIRQSDANITKELNLWDCWDLNFEENLDQYCIKSGDSYIVNKKYNWRPHIYMSNQEVMITSDMDDEKRLIKFSQIILEQLHYFKPSKDWYWDTTLEMPISAVKYYTGDRSTGTSATFFTPRNPYLDKQHQDELYTSGTPEYVIAADISWNFEPSRHVNMESKSIQEPTIYARHLFRIKDGKAFADEFSSSYEKNQEYVRKNLRHVQARSGVDFQIRLDAPVPVENTTRSRYYYKAGENEYRRVCSADVRVFKGTEEFNNNYFDNDKNVDSTYFHLDAIVTAFDERIIDGIPYHLHGSETNAYYRMLGASSKAAVAGTTYRVQLLAKDVDGQVIKVKGENDGQEHDLVLQEFVIRFVGERSGAMITEAKMNQEAEKYEYLTDAFMENAYGDEDGQPRDKVNFDEYRYLQSKSVVAEPNDYIYTVDEAKNWRYFKWPMTWDESSYIFGFDKLHDYNSYQIVTNAMVTRYHGCQFPYAPTGYTPNFKPGLEKAGLYDRLFYNTKGKEAGYYLTVNAASDPGVMSRLQINDLCLGSTIYVSAWLVEFSGSETANLTFNFIAVLDEEHGNQRIPIHSFVTGYIPFEDANGNKLTDFDKKYDKDGMVLKETAGDMGQWMRVFYKFVPSFTDKDFKIGDVDHFELELDNNCRSSRGADYGIDDIRLYVAKPDISAAQKVLVCADADLTGDTGSHEIKVSTNYESLMQALGVDEPTAETDNREIQIYYTFLDKEKWEAAIEANKEDKVDGFKTAFETPGVQLEFDHNSDGNQTKFGNLTFNTFYTKNGKYDYDDNKHGIAYYETVTVGDEQVRNIVFAAAPRNSLLKVYGEYIIALWCPSQSGEATQNITEPGYEEFKPESDCSRTCTFRIESSGAIKINGVIRDPQQEIVVCEHESPVIQIDLTAKPTGSDSNEPISIKNAYYDWYLGSWDEFYDVKTKGGKTLHECLEKFRAVSIYHNTETLDGVTPDQEFTQDMIDLLVELATPKDAETPAKLYLHQTSFVFPPVEIVKDEEGNQVEDAYAHVVAVPIEIYNEKYTICTQPTEVVLKVDNHAPTMLNGIYEAIPYPKSMVDVPLRVGLRQLTKVSCKADNAEKHESLLYVPIRLVKPVTANVQSMSPDQTNRNLVLVQTNDPYYKDLNYQRPSDNESLLAVGYLRSLDANENGGANNRLGVVFYDDFHFREGYYYRVRFSYVEDSPTMIADEEDSKEGDEDDEPEDDRPACNGQLLFTIKVVPEYQKWVGNGTNLNWANDANWSRVSYDDLYVTDNTRKTDLDAFVTDEGTSNDNITSYAPLDFTKVIIDNTATTPHLFNPTTSPVSLDSKTYQWVSTADDTEAGDATYNIQYDLAAYVSGKNIASRPWYTHRCEHIHFRPGAEIMNQQYLEADSAWVDLELSPSRWYTLASPLQGVVAGDMYLPTAGARQETELFRKIEFKPEDGYDRFAPAVFQRSWNKKATATVYELDGNKRDVAVATTWSNVYNDVLESYGPGQGFSIKTDVGALTSSSQPEKVLFRLPKDDKSYSYYEHGSGTKVSAPVNVPRQNPYKLNTFDSSGKIEVTVEARTNSKYFMVGNPFMAHLDMEKFLSANEDVIQHKLWVMTANSQTSAIMDNKGYLIGTDENAGYLPPMQGFFVEAKAGEVGSIKVKFTPDMLHVDQHKENLGNEIKSVNPHRLMDATYAMRITAKVDGAKTSTALVAIDADASQAYHAEEDVVLLTDASQRIPAIVYTVAGGTATSINTIDCLKRTPLGVVAADDTETTLVFDNVDCLGGAMLYDAENDEYTTLYSGMEYRVKGSSSSNLYIVSDIEDELQPSGIVIDVKGRNCSVTSTDGFDLRATVSDTLGRVIAMHEGADTLTFRLDPGMYVIEAADGQSSEAVKVVIR